MDGVSDLVAISCVFFALGFCGGMMLMGGIMYERGTSKKKKPYWADDNERC